MFVVCGEALFDLFHTAAVTGGLQFEARLGGSPFNMAVGLARLQQPVSFFGGISRDFFGERLMQALNDEGVGTGTVQRSDARTPLSVVGLDAAGVPAYAFYGEGGADRMLTSHDIALPNAARVLQLGSYALVVEPSATALKALVATHHERLLIAYDPNVRLNVEPDVERWRDALRWMLPRTSVLKISDEDLQLLHPGLSPENAAATWLAEGVSLVVVTRGAQGAEAWTAQTRAQVAGQRVEVVDTVGAGDSFQAALLCWLAEHGALQTEALRSLRPDQLEAALRFASQAAAVTCGRRGADLPRRGELLLP